MFNFFYLKQLKSAKLHVIYRTFFTLDFKENSPPLSTDMQKSVDTSQSTSSNTEEGSRVEVATATLINLESPVSTSDAVDSATAIQEEKDNTGKETEDKVEERGEDQLDSIEASEQWQNSKMQMSTVSVL